MTEHNTGVEALLALRNGNLVSGARDRKIILWDTNIWQVKKTFFGHTSSIMSLAELKNGDIASGSYNGELFIWSINEGVIKTRLMAHTKSINTLNILHNGDLVSGGEDFKLLIWNVESGSIKMQLNPEFSSSGIVVYPQAIGILSNGNIATGVKSLITTNGGYIWINEPVGGSLINKINAHSKMSLYDLVVLPNGNIASIGNSQSNKYVIKIFNENGGLVNEILNAHTNIATSLAAMPNGDLVSCAWDKQVKIWNVQTGQLKRILTGHTNYVYSVAALSNNVIVSGSFDNTIRVWMLDKI